MPRRAGHTRVLRTSTPGRWSGATYEPCDGAMSEGRLTLRFMPEQTATAFPKDLLDARRELHEVHAELHAFLEDKPWSVGPSEGWDDVETRRWSPSVRPATDGWAEEDIRPRE